MAEMGERRKARSCIGTYGVMGITQIKKSLGFQAFPCIVRWFHNHNLHLMLETIYCLVTFSSSAVIGYDDFSEETAVQVA